MKSVLTKEGLSQLWDSISNKFVRKENGKGLSTNDYTDDDKKKVDELESTYVKIDVFQDTKTTFERKITDAVNGGLSLLSVKGEYRQDGIPTPDVPIEIENSIINTLKTTGKNLLSNTKKTTTTNGVTFKVNDDGSILINGTATAKTTFIVNSNVKLEIGKYIFADNYRPYNVTAGVDQNKNNAWELVIASHGAEFEITEENKDRTFTFYFSVNSGATVSNRLVYPMLRKSSDDAIYKPYKSVEIALSAPITLRASGDLRDTIVKQDGVYGVLRKFATFVLDGTQDIYRETAGENGYRFRLLYGLSNIYTPESYSTVASMLCNRFVVSKWTDIFYGRENTIGIDSKMIGWYHEDFKSYTVEEMKTYLGTNPISGYYRLATPVFEPLPLEDQIKLHALETFDDVTYLSTDSVIEPIIEAEYGVSVAGGYSLKALNIAEANKVRYEQLNTLTNELATQLVAGNEV